MRGGSEEEGEERKGGRGDEGRNDRKKEEMKEGSEERMGGGREGNWATACLSGDSDWISSCPSCTISGYFLGDPQDKSHLVICFLPAYCDVMLGGDPAAL